MASNYSYIGNGQVYLRNRAGTTGPLPIGNVSALSFGVEEETIELQDFRTGGGGLYNSVSRVSNMTFSADLHDLSPENLAMALRGESSTVASGAIVDEVHTAKDDALVRTTYLPDQTTIVVKDNTGATTYVEDTDYTTNGAGIVVLSTGAIADGATIKISYTKLAAVKVETLTKVGQEYELIFVGLNEASSGKPAVVQAYKVRPTPASELALIGGEFATLTITGSVLADTSVVGSGLSQYLKIDMQAH